MPNRAKTKKCISRICARASLATALTVRAVELADRTPPSTRARAVSSPRASSSRGTFASEDNRNDFDMSIDGDLDRLSSQIVQIFEGTSAAGRVSNRATSPAANSGGDGLVRLPSFDDGDGDDEISYKLLLKLYRKVKKCFDSKRRGGKDAIASYATLASELGEAAGNKELSLAVEYWESLGEVSCAANSSCSGVL